MEEFITQLPFSPSQIGASTLIILFGWSLATNFLYTRGQVTQILEANTKTSDIWKEVAKENQETIRIQATQLELLVRQTSSILRILEDLEKCTKRIKEEAGNR